MVMGKCWVSPIAFKPIRVDHANGYNELSYFECNWVSGNAKPGRKKGKFGPVVFVAYFGFIFNSINFFVILS
jgi:hypothetical protein